MVDSHILKDGRDSNFELLRIVLMLMIVAHHFTVHSGFSFSNSFLFNKIFLAFFGSGGKIGVNGFILISGYFLIRKDFDYVKLFKYVFQIWFYGIVLVAFAIIFGIYSFKLRELITYVLPFGYMNWFARTYLVLLLFYPYLNRMLLSFDKKQYLCFLVLGLFVWYIIPTILNTFGLGINMEFSNLIAFFYVYSIGAYIKLYFCDVVVKDTGKLTLISYFAMVVLGIIVNFVVFKSPLKGLFFFAQLSSPLALICSVCLFLFFKQMNLIFNKYINTVAAISFGVYLIHDSNVLRRFIWHNLLKTKEYYSSDFLVFYALFFVLIVFVVTGIIEYLRIELFEKRYYNYCTKLANRMDSISFRWEK